MRVSRRPWLRSGSVRLRATMAATLLTALVLGLASILIVQLVERDLENNTRAALGDALEAASHSASGEVSERQRESADGEGSESTDVGGADGASGGDLRQQQIADQSIREVRAGVDAASQALLVIVPIVVALLGLAIWFTVGRALRPVRAISTQVAAITGSTLDERVPEPASEDEIAELAALMNQMLDRLQAASDRQRAFVADASHELKSPLSTIVAAAEIAAVSPDPQKLQKLAAKVGGEARRMQALVTDLLDLARLDEQRHDNDATTVDVAAVCRDVVERVDPAGKDITFTPTGPAAVSGVRSQLERAIFNLVDNAVHHSSRRVRVRTSLRGDSVWVVVEDDGPGIPEQYRGRVFERFVRLDESRGRRSGGTGIGLALVKAITVRHRGTIDIDESPDLGGARFSLGLLRQSDPTAADQGVADLSRTAAASILSRK